MRLRHETLPALTELFMNQRDFPDLIGETRAAIGQVARTGYETLALLASTSESGRMNSANGRWSKITSVVLPEGPKSISGNPNYQITGTAIGMDESRIPLLGWKVPGVRGPKRVILELGSTERSQEEYTFSVDSKGDVLYQDTSYMRSTKKIGHPDYDVNVFHDLPEMYRDYADRYSGALVVASFVAASLAATHDIDIDTERISPLIEDWRSVHPLGTKGTMANDNLRFLPPDLAQQVAA